MHNFNSDPFNEAIVFDEFILILGIVFSFLLSTFLEKTDHHSILIYVSLIILISTASFYTHLFFTAPSLKRLIYFIIMILFIIFYYATLFKFFGICTGLDDKGKQIVEHFITWHEPIYFSTVTWTTLGYGDLSPIDELHLLASIEALMGQIFMALMMGKVLYILQIRN